MNKRELPTLIFEIADTLGFDVTRRREEKVGSLTGTAKWRVPLLSGLDWTIQPKIVDSATYEWEDKAGVLVHVTGSLYLLLLVDGAKEENYANLWVIDGSKLNWAKRSTFLVFPSVWERPVLYKMVCEGVVAGFRRSRQAVHWSPMESARQTMSEYIASKEPDKPTPAELAVQKIKEGMPLSERYRTKGPRGV